MSLRMVFCDNCQTETDHLHLHDTAHGIVGTHMAGSERFECAECGRVTFYWQNDGRFTFVLDPVDR